MNIRNIIQTSLNPTSPGYSAVSHRPVPPETSPSCCLNATSPGYSAVSCHQSKPTLEQQLLRLNPTSPGYSAVSFQNVFGDPMDSDRLNPTSHGYSAVSLCLSG